MRAQRASTRPSTAVANEAVTLILVVALATTFAVSPASAVSQSTAIVDTFQPSARASAMAGAYTSLAEGPFAVRWNPAALAFSHDLQVGFDHAALIPDFADDVWIYHLGASGRVSPVGLGVQYVRLDHGEQTVVDESGEVFDTFESYESSLRLGAGVELTDLFGLETDPHVFDVGVGAVANRLLVHLAPAGAFEDIVGEIEGEAWTADVGGLLRYGRWFSPDSENPDARSYVGLRLGAALHVLSDQEMTFDGTDQADPLPRRVNYGLAMEFALFPQQEVGMLVRGSLAYERLDMLVDGDDTKIDSLGLEIVVAEVLALRGGTYDDPEGDILNGTIGAGLRIPLRGYGVTICLDYANVPQATTLSRREQLSVSVRAELP